MNFTKVIIFFIFIILISISYTSAISVNVDIGARVRSTVPDLNEGSYSKWAAAATYQKTYIEVPTEAIGYNVSLYMRSAGSTGSYHIDTYSTSTFEENIITWNNAPAKNDLLSEWYGSVTSEQWFHITIPYVSQYIVLVQVGTPKALTVHSDDSSDKPYMLYVIPPATLMEFTNEPIKVTTYAYLECNLDDYWNTHANEHFYLSYDYYYKNMSNYTIIDFNELELNSQNTVNYIPTYYPYFNQTGGCEIKASILYTYNDPVYTEEQLGGIGYYISTVLVNSTYEPPDIPEEPEEPEIPDPESKPEPKPDPPIPPTQPNGTGVNQSINVSWTGEYYNTVNNTFNGLCSPIYNFTNWSLSPVYSLNSSIREFNYHMNESFIQTAQDSSILYDSINTIYGAIHPKIRNVITYYLIWVVLLIILKKD